MNGHQIMTQATKPTPAAPEALILDLATRHFFVQTLDTRNWRACTRLDFHDVAVWAIRAALSEAYEAGRIAGAKAMLAAATSRSKDQTMATTTIRIDIARLPDYLDRSRMNSAAASTEAALIYEA